MFSIRRTEMMAKNGMRLAADRVVPEPSSKRIWFVLAAFCMMVLGGCVSAKTLAPLAQQNKTNLNDLTMNVRSANRMRNNMVDAVCQNHLQHRITDIAEEFVDVLEAYNMELPSKSGWPAYLSAYVELKTKYENIDTARKNPDVAKDMEKMKRDAGWIYTAVSDPEFTPAKAKQLQRSLEILRSTYQVKGDTRTYVDRACELLCGIDPNLAFRRDVVKATNEINDKLNKVILEQLTIANGNADMFLKATEADINLAETTRGVLNATDTHDMTKALADRYIDDPAVKKEVLKLFTDLGTSATK